MKSHEALEAAIGRNTVEHAKALGLSVSLVNKWKEPTTDWTDSGALNPLDRIETVIAGALRLGGAREDALAPLHYLARQFKLIVIDIPELKGAPGEISEELLKTVKEFGELAGDAGKTLADGCISPQEYKRLHKEAWELINQTMAFLKRAGESVK